MREDDPLKAIYAFVERAYIRLQAGDVLNRCLEDKHSRAIQSWVEGLVIAGPQNIGTIREILVEVGERKTQLGEDVHQILQHFEKNIKSKGINLSLLKEPEPLRRLAPVSFLALLREQGISDEEIQIDCLQQLQDTRELLSSLAGHIRLLDEIEVYLQDWMWGLVYQTARQERTENMDNPPVN
jgi:hypothetical protein